MTSISFNNLLGEWTGMDKSELVFIKKFSSFIASFT